MVYQKYGPSYSNFDTSRNTWRATVRYDQGIEQELILFTKTFVRTIGNTDSKYTNPQFLDAFIKLVVDYLSAYTMRSPLYNTRKDAKAALTKTLWDDFAYIQQMLRVQASKRTARAERNKAYLSRDRDAAAAYAKIKSSRRDVMSSRDSKQK